MKKVIKFFVDEYKWLSNFYNVENRLTVEHIYQAEKAYYLIDKYKILMLETPGKAKRMGAKITLRKDWEKIKEKVMFDALTVKFQNEELKQKLIDTGDAILIEGNDWHDNIWGDCICENCKNTNGLNKLGNMLMKIRDELKNENKK